LLLPDFVTTFTTTPARMPYSAWKLLVRTETSWIDSRLGVTVVFHRCLIDVAAAVQIHLGLSAVLAIHSKIVCSRGIELAANDALIINRGCAGIIFNSVDQLRTLRGISVT